MKKILYIKLNHFSEVVLTESAVRLTKQAFPDSELHYLTKSDYADLVKTFTGVSKVVILKKNINFIKNIREEKYDYIIDLDDNLISLIIKTVASAKKVITYDNQYFLKKMIIASMTKKNIDSIVWSYIKAVAKLPNVNIDLDNIDINKSYYPALQIDPDILNRVKEIMLSYKVTQDQPLIGIFTGASKITQQYPVEKWANFILSIPEEWECRIAIIGTYKEKINAIELKSITGVSLIDLTGVFSPSQLPAVISMLDFVLTNDSSPMHIAAALQKRQIAIFGSTHTSLGYRPLNDKAHVIQKNLRCQPCSVRGKKYCSKRHLKCMYEIHSSEIFKIFNKEYLKLMINN